MAFAAYFNVPRIPAGAYYVVDFVTTQHIQLFFRGNRLNNTVSDRLAFAFYVCAHNLEPVLFPYVDHADDGTIHDVAAIRAPAYSHNNAAAGIHDINPLADLGHDYEGFNGAMIREVAYFIDQGTTWMMQLSGAEAHKHITMDNVKNYFLNIEMHVNSSEMLMRIIRHIARTRRAALMVPNVRINLTADRWGRYRLAVSSLGSCYTTYTATYPALVVGRTLTTQAALVNIVAAPWDQALIPLVSGNDITVIAIGLDVAGVFPRGWVSGDKALRNANLAVRTRLVALFRRVIALTSNTTNIENAVSLDAALTAAGL
jgi:hypothetical protein